MRWSLSAVSTAAAIGIIIAVVGMLASHIDRNPVTPINPNVILNIHGQLFNNTTKQKFKTKVLKTFMNLSLNTAEMTIEYGIFIIVYFSTSCKIYEYIILH